MNRLRKFPLVYLATPYSKFRPSIHYAFIEAARLAAHLLACGVKVYSPIAHTHPLAIYGGLDPFDHAIWLPFDQAMMDASAALVVAQMRGWDVSFGVAHERDEFERMGKPIFFLHPKFLTVATVPYEIPQVPELVRA